MHRAVINRIVGRKSLEAIQAEAEIDECADVPKFKLFDLLCIGIGSTVGSGVFVLVGEILPEAGPSAILSWFGACLVCLASALSYMELSIRIPTSGSCYAYSYHALGELAGVIGAACLTLEYGISGAGVARGWSALMASMTNADHETPIWHSAADPKLSSVGLYFDYAAAILMLAAVLLTSTGTTVSKLIINIFTVVKVILVTFFIAGGLCAWRVDIFASRKAFFPHGAVGTVRSISVLFFGFVGFDEVCCLASKSHNPSYTIPRALAGTLLASAVMSMLAQLSLSVMVPSEHSATWPNAFGSVGWNNCAMIASIGELTLLPLVVLLSFIPQPELLGSMARDGLIPAAFARKDSEGTYVWGSNVSGAAMVAVAAFVPFNVLWNLVSLGVLVGFNLTNTSLIMMRCGGVGRDRMQNKVHAALVTLWVSGALGSYTLWNGVVGPTLEGDHWKLSSLVAGTIMLFIALGVLVVIYLHGVPMEGCHPLHFQVPAVPFVPGLAIIMNFSLMANMSFRDHALFALFVLVAASTYLEFARRQLLELGGLDQGKSR